MQKCEFTKNSQKSTPIKNIEKEELEKIALG